MATNGTPINASMVLAAEPHQVISRVMQATQSVPSSSFDQTAITTDGQTYLNGNRKFLPTWALVVAILGALFFLIGLVALVVRNNESFSIQVAEVNGGTRLTISGTASPVIVTQLNSVIQSFRRISA
jgi:hypothetical protein